MAATERIEGSYRSLLSSGGHRSPPGERALGVISSLDIAGTLAWGRA